MGLGNKIVSILQQAKAIEKVKQDQRATEATSFKKVDPKLPMSKRRTRTLQNQSQLNNQQTLLGG